MLQITMQSHNATGGYDILLDPSHDRKTGETGAHK